MSSALNDPRPVSEHRQALQAWLVNHTGELDPYRDLPPDLDRQVEHLRRYQRFLYDEGWLRYGWPEALGGLGGSVILRAVLCEELTAAGYPPPISFGMIEVLAPAVAHFAPAIAKWALPPLLRGDEIWCQGFSEPEAGSDLASLRLRAHDDGTCWRVSGQKIWTSFAQYAGRCVLLARTGTKEERHRGITALFVDMDSPGITVRPIRAMTGDVEFAETYFDDVPVPKERVIGSVGGGWAFSMFVLSCERGTVAWQRQAWMQRRLRELVAQAPDDDRLGPWAGEAYSLLYGLRLASRRTLRLLDAGEVAGAEASVDKLLMSGCEQFLFDGGLNLLPDDVLFGDDPMAETWRSQYLHSRAASIYGGASEIQRNIVAEHLLGLPREA